jgi:hypothetical protein
VPDYAFLFEHSQGRLVCVVEVSSGEESAIRLRQKLEAYANWSETDEARSFLMELYREHGAEQPRPNYRCLWVMHNRLAGADDVRVKQVVQAASHIPEGLRSRVWCTTATALAKGKPHIWLRLADLQALGELVSEGRSRQWQRQLSRQADAAPRHSLFPTVEVVR